MFVVEVVFGNIDPGDVPLKKVDQVAIALLSAYPQSTADAVLAASNRRRRLLFNADIDIHVTTFSDPVVVRKTMENSILNGTFLSMLENLDAAQFAHVSMTLREVARGADTEEGFNHVGVIILLCLAAGCVVIGVFFLWRKKSGGSNTITCPDCPSFIPFSRGANRKHFSFSVENPLYQEPRFEKEQYGNVRGSYTEAPSYENLNATTATAEDSLTGMEEEDMYEEPAWLKSSSANAYALTNVEDTDVTNGGTGSVADGAEADAGAPTLPTSSKV